MARADPPRGLLAISDRRQLPGGALAPWCRAVVAAGIESVQLREKDLSPRALLGLAQELRHSAPARLRLLVNARPDAALAAGAAGVHLPAAGLPTAAVVARFGRWLCVGRSTHSLEEVRRAAAEGADYVVFGPIYPTPAKAAYGPPLGLGALEAACRLGVPVLAVGGVTIERLPELATVGAAGAAGIREFLRPEGLTALVAQASRSFAMSR